MRISLLLLVTVLTLTWAKTPFHVTPNRGIPHDASPLKKTSPSRQIQEVHRLPPNNPLPVHFDLQLTPILDDGEVPDGYEQLRVYGEVTITITPVETVSTIVLNLHDNVDIGGAPIVTHEDGTVVGDAIGLKEPAKEFYTITLQDGAQLVQGEEYKVTMRFFSRVHNEPGHLYGIYRGWFLDAEGAESIMLSTQFEPTGAREAFPCFDEPSIKATYKVSIGHGPTYTALANNALEENDPLTPHPTIEGWFMSNFKVTTKMSAYLFAILVAKTDKYTSVVSPTNPDVKVFGPANLVLPSGRDGGAYAAIQSTAIFANFEEYTGIPYPMDKMDSVAIPQFDAGAMENYGLNTYRTYLLLTYGSESFETDRELTTQILSHELIHQWFGNLATCGFWDQIWLNEGFADYFQYVGIQGVADHFKPLESRQFASTQVGLEYDASDRTHPVINDAAATGLTYADFSSVFTAISYEKAGSLLRMLESVMNPVRFKAGLVHYLDAKKEQGAVQDDLFNSLQLQIQDDETLPPDTVIKDIMDTWTYHTGFPLVRVSKSATEGKIYIGQERFAPNVAYTQVQGDFLDRNHLWTIPVILSTPDTPRTTCWIDKGSALKSCQVDTSEWVLVNPDGAGFYRVLYDVPLLTAILDLLESEDFEDISVNARSQIIDDYFTFVNWKHTRVENALELTKYLNREEAPVVWYTTLFHLTGYFNRLIGGESEAAYDAFNIYMRSRLDAVLGAIGLEQPVDAVGANVILRSQLLDWACALGHQPCIDYATAAFTAWDPAVPDTKIPVDVREVLFCSAVGADRANYDIALARYMDGTTSVEDKARLLNALACTGDLAAIDALLGYVLNGGVEIGGGDRVALFEFIAGNTLGGRTRAIEFILLNAEGLIGAEEVGPGGVLVFYDTLRNFVLSENQIADLAQLTVEFDEELAGVKSQLDVYLGEMRSNRAWRAENEGRLATWFSSNNPQTP